MRSYGSLVVCSRCMISMCGGRCLGATRNSASATQSASTLSSRPAWPPNPPIGCCRTEERADNLADGRFHVGLCRRRGWTDPSYACYRDPAGFTCLVLVNGREYQTDLAYASDTLAQENAAMRAFMVCQNFSVNGGMLARNGIVQGLPANETGRHRRSRDRNGRRSGTHSSSSSTASFD